MTAHFILTARSSVINGKLEIRREGTFRWKGKTRPNESSRQPWHTVVDEVQRCLRRRLGGVM